MDQKEKTVLRTLAWFSLFDYPLSMFELWKWQLQDGSPLPFHELRLAARNLAHTGVLREEYGLVCLAEKAHQFTVREERFVDAIKKQRRVRLALAYLKHVPWVRGIAVCNTLAWMHTKKTSDIDLFVIVRSGTIWLTRLLCVLPFSLLRLRPGQTQVSPLCFSFFLSDTNLDLSSLRVDERDIYLAYWVRSIRPLLDRDGVFETFARANAWASRDLPCAWGSGLDPRGVRDVHETGLPILRGLERLARRLQEKKFPAVITQLANRDTRVVVSDAMLKFHVEDRRERFQHEYQTLCRSLGIASH